METPRWDYRWRRTYYVEEERSGDYVAWIKYRHVWQPDLKTEQPYPSDDGLNYMGERGFELVTITTSQTSLVTRASPQGDSWSNFPVYTLYFKRQLAEGEQAEFRLESPGEAQPADA